MNELYLERFELAAERIRQIPEEESAAAPFRDFFAKEAKFLCSMLDLMEKHPANLKGPESREELEKRNRALYEEILPGNYGNCYGNPTYAKKMLGPDYGNLFSFLYTELRGVIVYVYEERLWDLLVSLELFLEIYSMFSEEIPESSLVKNALYWYVSDYMPEMMDYRTRELVDPSLDFATTIVMEADLSDPAYLYRYGEYVSENEIRTARHLASMPEEEIEAMARTYTEGYRIGFVLGNKDLSKKKTVNIRYQLGFERMVRAAIGQFAAMGLKPVIYRSATHSINKRAQMRIGYSGAVPNLQFDFDHKGDAALYLDENLVTGKLRELQNAFETYKREANTHAGPACIEVFGETPFVPETNRDALSLSDEQQELYVRYNLESGQITNRYIIGSERSFTIIAYPVAEIGEDYEEIFRETVKINTLDYTKYHRIQQTIIDALDQGDEVHIKGMNRNETDLTVCLHTLEDPEKQTNFENCVADVNIPVGEVFTSPKLTGTRGLLHVSRVFLGEFDYIDLKILVKDGMIEAYTCQNFETEEDNRRYIEDNILFQHKSLPMGEFAIGTNTTAYKMAEKYGIASRLPILIAEKMGPHFAFGDTCYSWQEDNAVYNPDGKEIIARDNEVSILRKTNPEKAYFGCHTDITIPYHELGAVTICCKDGRRIPVIEQGRFVLAGTEELNEPLDA